jgi:hypothetical protein
VSPGGSTLKGLLLGAYEARPTSLGVVGRLSPLFRVKGLQGRLLAIFFAHLPTLHAELTGTSSIEAHRLENVPAGGYERIWLPLGMEVRAARG